MNIDPPPWLKAMQNGVIGEARAKAFLLNRFWVLERSVDIDGADFIIQRKITNKNILDIQPPRLGVIQVKFFGATTTTQYIHKEYIVDDCDEIRTEFFLLCHYGNEENQRTCLLTAEDIRNSFPISNINGRDKYRITYDSIFATNKYLVSNQKRSLDRIEDALKHADFRSNRIFLSWALPSARSDDDGIPPLYKEPIGNWWGDLNSGFKDMKEVVSDALMNVENIYDLLCNLSVEPDPIRAKDILEEIESECKGFHGWYIPLPDNLYDKDFFDACIIHKRTVDNLKSDGLLDAFIDFKETMTYEVISSIKDELPFNRDTKCDVEIDYSIRDLIIKNISVKLIDAPTSFNTNAEAHNYNMLDINNSQQDTIKIVNRNKIQFTFMPGRYGFNGVKDQQLVDAFIKADLAIFKECMDSIYNLMYEW